VRDDEGAGQPRARLLAGRPRGDSARWLAIFAVSLGALLIRFLVPTPVGQADNRDGPRLMCGLGLGPVTGQHPRFFRFSYFEYLPRNACAGRLPYPSSELGPLEAGRLLTPVLGLPGTLNLIAVGVLLCALASVAIASLAVGLRIPLWAQLLVAAACWLIIADAAFFDVFGGPFSEPAALAGLMLVAAGVVYLGRGWRLTVFGLVLAGSGGFLAILSKEQYLVLAAPICITLVLAGADRGPWRGLQRFRNRQAAAAALVAAGLALLTAAYALWDYTSSYGQRLHHIQAVDMLFTDVVTRRSTAPAQLRALGLPVSWARYAGHYYWDTTSVRQSRLYPRYAGKLTDGNITHYLLTHPASILSIGHQLPPGLGLWWLVPVWLVLAAVAVIALRSGSRAGHLARPWHRDSAVLVLCMVGCAMLAFIPPAYYAGVATTRHMVGMNLATSLGLVVAAALAVSLIQQALTRPRWPAPVTARPGIGPRDPVSPAPRR
jgi:hypothetical protein